MAKRKQLKRASLLLLLLGVSLGGFCAGNSYYRVDVLTVGQGDAILVQGPQRVQMLIDGGPDDAVLQQLSRVMPLGDRYIEWVILSHPDADHLFGLVEVLAEYEVGLVVVPLYEKDNTLLQEWQRRLQETGSLPQVIFGARRLIVDDLWWFDVFHPTPQTLFPADSSNNASLVFRMHIGDRTFLFTGDIEEEVEQRLVACCPDQLKSDWLKIPHHGSRTSSTEDFLSAVSPRWAALSSGANNDFGHPHQSVLRRLERFRIRFWRTDQEGILSFVTDGKIIIKQHWRWPLFLTAIDKYFGIVYNGDSK